MLTVIINHEHNANAVELRLAFEAHGPVKLIDSGSTISVDDRRHFDDCLPNVYYTGLLNRAAELAAGLPATDPVLVICSDVEISNPGELLACLRSAFTAPGHAVWAPSSRGSDLPQMWPESGGGLKRVSFVDGFCFAARRELLTTLCPVDLAVNRLGWGLDVHLGYLATRQRHYSLVDHRVSVHHPLGSGYSDGAATVQWETWASTLPRSARFYHRWALRPRFRYGRCHYLLRALTNLQASVIG